jgi:sugar lactone lactonase YvrE
MAARVDLAVDCRSVLGESPIWCGKEKRLYWIDINARTLSAYEPSVQQMPCLPVVLPALVGTIVPRAGGNLLACLEEDIVPVNADTRVVGLPVASVPQEHRARPARSASRALARPDARFERPAVQRQARRAVAEAALLHAAANQAARACASTTASATCKAGCGLERCTRRACPCATQTRLCALVGCTAC